MTHPLNRKYAQELVSNATVAVDEFSLEIMEDAVEVYENILEDLKERLEKANETLLDTADSYWEAIERARVRGKAEGVRLTLSYLEEYL